MIALKENPKYTEILLLRDMLIRAEIPFKWDTLFNGHQILINYEACNTTKTKREWHKNEWISVIEHDLSYGHKENLLEMQGCLTEEEFSKHKWGTDDMHNCITHKKASQCFRRIYYCYTHNKRFFEFEADKKRKYVKKAKPEEAENK